MYDIVFVCLRGYPAGGCYGGEVSLLTSTCVTFDSRGLALGGCLSLELSWFEHLVGRFDRNFLVLGCIPLGDALR
jgi:hypothetical protein